MVDLPCSRCLTSPGPNQLRQATSNNVANDIKRSYSSRNDEIYSKVFAACEWLVMNDFLEVRNPQGFFDISKKGNDIKKADDLKAYLKREKSKDMSDDLHLNRLKKIYQATGGSQRMWVNLADVLKDEGISKVEIDNEAEYLEGEGWIKALGSEGIDFFITHAGIEVAQNHLGYGFITGEPGKVLTTIILPNVPPVEIQESLESFRADHPDPHKVAFVMMRFGNTKAHTDIVTGIQNTLAPYGITAVRADDKQYHDDLFPNVLTYIYGCGFGIAIFERIETEEFNPNVALEVGYMFAFKKAVCLLKDRTLKTLQADLVGKLYRVFDPLDPIKTIPEELARWLRDKGLV